ncbi:hypothetical protein NX774_21325 [Massilia agilis]|uniref:Baseplate J-like protein n=1 Tax=Massilia agilis TaxID=1811226 RepID=A0ABT2DHX9_9BURK|nr:hypothetical protein [Massilia agilis]MCS0810469.1 hypothetical protein [Massilia agilis]
MSGPGTNANSRAARLAQALDPASCPVDARDSRDRLAFVAELARLVLYYDAQNRLAGDWQPFFLKDPAILLAAIGKTDYKAGHVQFVQLDQRFMSSGDGERIALVNDLCRLLREAFVTLNRWLHFMQRGGRDYPLGAFLKKKIETSLSGQLWTMVACQQFLSIQTGNNPDGQVGRPDTATYQGFEAAWARDMPVWRPEGDALSAGWKTLCAAWLAVFDVLVQTVEQASVQFYAQVDNPTRFPDTALLIAFSALMDKQRALVNGYGQQHLDFYYSRVLQETPLPAQPDEVFVFLSLKAAAGTLALPQGAEFTAGTYPDNSDIVFASDAPVEINRAAIASACALYYQPQAPDPGLYRTDCGNPTQQPQPWAAFGGAGGTQVTQGFALASPMLLLQGGSRNITITLEFAAAPPAGLFDGATCYLSTGTAWLAVPPAQVSLAPTSIGISLLPTDPPIVAFTQPQEGLSSDWPMFRLLLGPSANLLEPPSLSQVKIGVTVTGLSQLSLANDVSPLPDTGAAEMFGPVPALGNCFYVGSREVFAKPVETLGVTIHWDNLPADFADYYQDYNTYLMSRPAPVQTFDNTAFRGQWSLLLAQGWEPLLPTAPPPVEDSLAPTCLFQQATPAPAAVPAPTPAPAPAVPPNLAQSTFTFAPSKEAPIPPVPDLARSALPPPLQAAAGYLRFALQAPAWAFGYELYPKLVSHITLLNAQTLIDMAKQPSLLSRIWTSIKKFVAGIVAAFKKIGAAVAAVFKKIGAWFKKILGKPAEDDTGTVTPQPTPAPGPALLEMPNTPYSPRQAGVSVDYTASSTATVSAVAPPAGAQPLQLFHVGPFQSYLAFDAEVAGGQGFAACIPGAAAGGLPLFPGVGGQGALYLGLGGVSAACTLSLFLEVCSGAGEDSVDWFCWGAAGWEPVTLLEDGTDGLRRSGIVRLALPAPVPCPVMASGNYWLALASGKTAPNVTLGYVQTQALKLRRADASMFAPGQVPLIDANAITAMRNQPPTIGAIVQPFPSGGGLPAETQDSFGGFASFYRRVAARLNHKDRCSSLRNYEDMAYGASQDLYFARALADEDGQVTVALVSRYASATLPNAWRPVMNAAELDTLQQYFAQRVSAMAQPCVAGFTHQEVTVKATLVVASDAIPATLLAELGQWLRLYLSPWIDSDLAQMDMALGLTSSGVISVLRSHPQVLSIAAFSLLGADGAPLQPGTGGLFNPEPGAMFVTAMEHALSVATPDAPGSPAAAGDDANAVAAGEEVAA